MGLAALSVNTRGHDSVFGASPGNVRRRFGAAYEIVDECRLDVAAWIDFLKSRGHQSLVLIGHSLGAVKGVYTQSHEKFSAVAAVIAISAPRLSYSAFMNAPESSLFWESMHTAEEMEKATGLKFATSLDEVEVVCCEGDSREVPMRASAAPIRAA
jgi:pimeloyl-ACP methyl ester carboxylesterase